MGVQESEEFSPNYGKTVQITIEMGGDAFYPEPFEQVYSILDRLLDTLHKDQEVRDHVLLDDSGNTVGAIIVSDGD